MNVLKKSAVLYHYPCPDGVFAALAAHLYFSATSTPALFFPNAVYNPIRAEKLPLHEIGNLYLLDFIGPPGFLQQISSVVDKVIILDHHKGALKISEGETIGENATNVIDMERSGATIAYSYFRGMLVGGDNKEEQETIVNQYDRLKRLFEYIEDADLWRWHLPNSKAFSSGLSDLNIEYSVGLNSSLFDQLLSLDADLIISQGMMSLHQKQALIDEALSQSYEIALGAGAFGRCLAVDADSCSHLRSELGHQLAHESHKRKLRSIGAVVYTVPDLKNDQLLKISLRSLDDEDTIPISTEFGGNGHMNASSFMLSSADFELWKV